MTNRRIRRWVALFGAAAILSTACGGDAATDPETESDQTASQAAGGGETDAQTDEPSASEGGMDDADRTHRFQALGIKGPVHLDPVTGITPCEMEPLRWVYDSLVRQGPDGELEPGLAESWESPDATTFVLNLRHDVQFQDGTPFTAEAVKAHLERGKDHAESTIADSLEFIESIEVPDEHTVVLNLAAPRVGVLPSLLTQRAGMVPSPTALDEGGAGYGTEGAIGAGPYTYDDHTPGEDIHVSSWDGYWQPEIQTFAGIDMLGSAEEFQIERIRDGEVSYTALKDAQLPEAIAGKEQGDVDYRVSPTDQYAEIYLNWTVAPFDDLRVRQALNHAVDRELLVEALTDGSGTVASSPLRADSWAHDSAVEGMYPYDPQKAKDLLAEAGYPDGLSLTMGMIEHPYYTRMAQALQDMVKESGFDFELESVTGGEINERLYVLRDLPIANTAFSGSADPGITLEQKFSSAGNNNPAGATAEGIDDLLAAGAATLDQDERAENYRAAEAIIMEEALSVPLYHNGGLIAFDAELQGVEDKGYTTCTFGDFINAPKWFAAE